ncbi:MAG: hypothetical protein M9926_01820 [Lentimicrobium sp.]|uniref:hypothetical protein n=1 Tax=Lentimicrobium sp. TaxID=2034841 RepID=UPI0025FE7990|nr:hypothetical protein [Lentimicrobium sp.]MCO5255471.1 hypothetical protein [Lentimicrobium sp.]
MFRKNRIKSYDLNGNIKGIERKGSLSNWNTDIIDNLTYYYNGNQLIAVDDDILTDNGEYSRKTRPAIPGHRIFVCVL